MTSIGNRVAHRMAGPGGRGRADRAAGGGRGAGPEASDRRGARRRRAAGFTLIELLVVMAILAGLAGMAAVLIPKMLRRGDQKAIELAISQMDAAIRAYANKRTNGDFPPTVLDKDDFPGVGLLSNLDNCGIESVVLCLNRNGLPSDLDVESIKEIKLRNEDEDRTPVVLTNFGPDVKDLFELVDVWGTPFAYFHHRDYGSAESKGLGRVVGVNGAQTAKPWTNPKTRMFYNRDSFQIISAGEDGIFNTEDDLTNFARE